MKKLSLFLLSFIVFLTLFQVIEQKQIELEFWPIHEAYAKAEKVVVDRVAEDPPPVQKQEVAPPQTNNLRVQAILSARNKAVIASAIDARIQDFNVVDGQKFKKGDVLVKYDCSMDYARLKEAKSRLSLTKSQLDAFEKLHDLKSVSEIEYLTAKENNIQNEAIVEQIQSRIKHCRITAPFDGRVKNKNASAHEFVQTGRVLMEIVSDENLRPEFLVPSEWLRWLNIGTPLKVIINETQKVYDARVVTIYGEVDPVSQSVQIAAQMDDYHEELLPGMSGFSYFDPKLVSKNIDRGFLGIVINQNVE